MVRDSVFALNTGRVIIGDSSFAEFRMKMTCGQIGGRYPMDFKILISHLLLSLTLLLASLSSVGAAHAPVDEDCQNITGLVIIGEVEKVTFKSHDLRLEARIDTGATTSSLGVANLQLFERDGKKWVQFSVQNPISGKPVEFKKPVVRIASIKRHGAEAQERPVVKLEILLGNIEMEREFTLADRSKYTFPVLIGRNVLSGKFLVDVNRKFSTGHTGGKEE